MANYMKCHSWIILDYRDSYGKSIGFHNDFLFWRHVPVVFLNAFVVGALNVLRISKKTDRISKLQITNCNCNSSSCKNCQYASCICNELLSQSWVFNEWLDWVPEIDSNANHSAKDFTLVGPEVGARKILLMHMQGHISFRTYAYANTICHTAQLCYCFGFNSVRTSDWVWNWELLLLSGS